MTLDQAAAEAEIAEGVELVRQAPKLMEVLEAVSKVYSIRKMELMSARRHAKYCEARHVFAWVALRLTPRGYSDIGRFLNRDHATIWHSDKEVAKRFHRLAGRVFAVAALLGAEPHEVTP